MNNYLDKLPQNILNKIILYNSHPTADLFKQEFLDDYELDNGSRFNTFYSYCRWKTYNLRATIYREMMRKRRLNVPTSSSSSSSSSTQRNHGIELIENKSKSYWNKQTISVIKAQAELRGYIFTDLEIKGEGTFKKYKKEDYLYVLFEILKIEIIIIIFIIIFLDTTLL